MVFLSKILTLRTATVTISASEAFIALAVSEKLLYLPVPTINLDLSILPATFKNLFSIYPPPIKWTISTLSLFLNFFSCN